MTEMEREDNEGGSPLTRHVTFRLHAREGLRVSIAGDFNQWNTSSHPLIKDEKGIWQIDLYLEAGQYGYKFVVDKEWRIDPECSLFVATAEGTINCVKVVE
jgi:1,4-alpha-glucan branching enzyme